MSEPCLGPCPSHLCLELTKVGMCRHEVACLRADLEQSRARHKMCQDNLAATSAERDSLRADVDKLRALVGRACAQLDDAVQLRDDADEWFVDIADIRKKAGL